MREAATYRSNWMEGIVETNCTIVDGHYIRDIEKNEDVDHYAHLIDEEVEYQGKVWIIDTETMTLVRPA